jgi:DNA repair protein RecO (recombination protein O)
VPAEESTAAIVLRARDYSESDRIVTLLTRDFGKLSGIAKGAKASRRRFERKLEPFSQVTLYFKRRPHGQLVFITRAERGEGPSVSLDDNLARIALGSYMLELADALTTEEGEAAGAYHILDSALSALARNSPTMALKHAYDLKMLGAAGFGLEFGQCRACASPVEGVDEVVYFVPARGGVVCIRCRPNAPESAVRVAHASAEAMIHLGTVSFDEAAALKNGGNDGALALSRFLSSILDRRLRSVDFLESVLEG